MDRIIVYPGAIPLDTHPLATNRNTMIALGALIQATLGTGTIVDGLAISQTTVPSMTVNIGPGSITLLSPVDATAYGSLAADTVRSIPKMGINLATTQLTLTAPGTAGQSQNYLVQVAFAETDNTLVVLPYYNAASPATPYSGPAGLGTSQNTLRPQTVTVSLKAGAAAATGSQTTPAVDAGYTALYAITVANGQTAITTANLAAGNPNGAALVPSAPFVLTKLPQMRVKLTANLNLYVATTGSDANTGLSTASAFLTLQKAWNTLVTNYDMNGYSATINVANGTYTAGVNCSGQLVGQNGVGVTFLGNPGSPASCLVSVSNGICFTASFGANITLIGFAVAATGSGGAGGIGQGIYGQVGSYIAFRNVSFGVCGNCHIGAATAAIVSAQGGISYTITGDSPYHLFSLSQSIIAIDSASVTLAGTPTFSVAFVFAGSGYVQVYSAIFSGSATGPRYNAIMNGVVNSNGGGASFLPGNAAGVISTQGQYL